MTLEAGVRLGHYTILSPLGSGGMGEVWAAEDARLKRKVALKILPSPLATDPDRLARFQREAEAVAALTHPNIVTIYSVEEEAGVRFMTMELVEGQRLDELIPRGGLPLIQVLDIGVALADALVASHEAGIIHRDLKPGNVMLAGRDRRVKVLDFGLAKLREGAALEEVTGATPITGEGRILGTVAYMSPEQAEGKRVDARSDLFSLGVVLFELSTGDRPFTGDSSLSVLSSILKDTPKSVTALRADLPRELGRIVRRCLQKDPDERYQTAKDLRADLKALRAEVESGELDGAPAAAGGASAVARAASGSGIGEAARPGVQAERRRVPRWALGVAVLLVAGIAAAIAAWQLTHLPVAPPARPFESITLRRLTTQGTIRGAAISPDAKLVAFAASEGGLQALVVRQIATAIDRVVVPAGRYWYNGVTFSPDGSFLFFVRRDADDKTEVRTLYQVSVLGGDPRKILDDVDSPVTLSPDGSRLAFVRGEPSRSASLLMVARVDGSELKELAARPWTSPYTADGPAWSPDGKRIAVQAGASGGDSFYFLVEVSTTDGSEKRIGSKSWGGIFQVAWLPDGTGLLMAAADATSGWFYQLWFVSYPEGVARRVSSDPNNYDVMSLSLDGRAAVTLQSDWLSSVWIAPKDNPQRAVSLTDGRYDGFGGLAWAGGDTIVFGSRDWGIWSVGADGRNRKLLTVGENNNRGPCVARDSRVVFFESWRDPAGIWRMDLDGGNLRLVAGANVASGPECTPDGKWVLYQGDDLSQIRTVRPDGTSGPPLAFSNAGPIAVSPDGTEVASLYPDAARLKSVLKVIPLGSTGPARTFDVPTGARIGHGSLRWTPDGRALSYVVASNIWVQPVAGGAPRQLTKFTEDLIWAHAWAPDGRLALARGRANADIVLITSESKK